MAKTLLLADDSVTIQKVVGITFASEDVDLITVDNGKDALIRIRERRPDLVLADVAMPGLDGYALCAAVKRDPALARIPIVLLTGTFEGFDESRAREVGADAHIAKPFEAQALVDLVFDVMARSAPAAPRAEAPAPPTRGIEAPGRRDLQPPLGSAEPDERDAFSFADMDFGAEPEERVAATRVFQAPLAARPQASEPRATGSASPGSREDFSLGFEDADTQPSSGGQRTTARGAAVDSLYDEAAFGEPGEEPFPLDRELALPAADPTGVDDGESAGPPRAALPDESIILGESAVFGEAPPVPSGSRVERERGWDPGPRVAQESAWDLTPDPVQDSGGVTPLISAVEEDEGETAPDAAQPEPRARAQRAPSSAPAPTLDPGALRDVFEKVAWEAFGPVMEQLLSQAIEKIEAVAWEIVPRLAERMIADEIARLKAEEPDGE